eukprot:s1036_g9.t1
MLCDAMLQLLFATFLFSGTALAELRVWNRSTFTGKESTSAVISAAALCADRQIERAPDICRPTAAVPLCELQGPNDAPAQLRPAAAGILTLTSGELRVTGQLHMTSLRLAAKNPACTRG